MKVLLVNPQFRFSFWSLTESCRMLGRKAAMPPLALLTVAALLPQEWEFRLADLNVRTLTSEDWEWTDLIMITGMIIQREELISLVLEAKARGKTVVVGGPYATSSSREVMAIGPDFLVRGEGENTIPLLLEALSSRQGESVIEADRRPDLAASPVPRFDLVEFEDYLMMGVQTSRGCPFDCEFCDIVRLYGRKPRYKDPDKVIAELDALYRLGWRRDIFISDDNFIGNRSHARAILHRLIPWMQSRKEPFCFSTQASMNLGQEPELINLLTAANFAYVILGVETPEPEILSAIGKYQNIRNPLGESLTKINANGLGMIITCIIGFDGETQGAGARLCRFIEKYAIPLVSLTLLSPIPGTRLWDRLAQEGRMIPEEISGDFYDLQFYYLPSRPQAEIKSEYVQAIDCLYEPSRYLARVYRFYLAMRPTRRALARQAGNPEPDRSPSVNPLPPLAYIFKEAAALGQLIWRQGIRPRYRWQFWRQLLGFYRRNPSRLVDYLLVCGIGENMFAFRKDLLQQWRQTQTR